MNTKLGYIHFIQQSIRAEEKTVTNFGRANDNLSRCLSALARCNKDWSEVARMDRGFDYGEFSGKACAEAMHNEQLSIIKQYGFSTIEQVVEKVEAVSTPKFAYELGIYFI